MQKREPQRRMKKNGTNKNGNEKKKCNRSASGVPTPTGAVGVILKRLKCLASLESVLCNNINVHFRPLSVALILTSSVNESAQGLTGHILTSAVIVPVTYTSLAFSLTTRALCCQLLFNTTTAARITQCIFFSFHFI